MTQSLRLPRNYVVGLEVVEEGRRSRDDQRNLGMKMQEVSMRMRKKSLVVEPHMQTRSWMQNDLVLQTMKVELKQEEAVVGKRN
jgi:hypothetical protein